MIVLMLIVSSLANIGSGLDPGARPVAAAVSGIDANPGALNDGDRLSIHLSGNRIVHRDVSGGLTGHGLDRSRP